MNNTTVILIPTYPFTQKSAGVLSQHKLCNILRKLGFDAYLVFIKGPEVVNKDWDTPIWHGSEEPVYSISIYSELIRGNPLNSRFTIYWVLGSFIHPPKPNRKQSKLFFWDGSGENVLRMNNLDIEYFAPTCELFRDKYAVYKGKNHDWKVTNLQKDQIIEIGRFGPNSPSREELRRILQTSKALIIAEDSLIIEEAIIAGCPVIVEPGTQINNYGRTIPSVYLRKSFHDWPDEYFLLEKIEESRSVLIASSRQSEDTIKNLTTFINMQVQSVTNDSSPLARFGRVALIRITLLRLRSAYSKGGIKGMFFVVLDSIKL
jgi:hypothetical protein